MKKMLLLVSLSLMFLPMTSASSWSMTGYSASNYLNANSSTTLDLSSLSCTDGQSTNVVVTVTWGDGSQTTSSGANLPGYILSPSPIHSYPLYVPAQYSGSIYCLEDGGMGHTTVPFTVSIYNGYAGGGLGGGSRPHPM